MNKINSLRQEKNLTLKELADILGVSEATVSRWENGKSDIRGKNLKKLSDFFDVSESYLLGYIERPSLPNRLRELRKEKKISIEQLSTKVGIDEGRIIALESREDFQNIKKNDAYYSDVKKLADFFNTTIDYLEGRVGYKEDIFYTDLASAIFSEFSSLAFSTIATMKYLSEESQRKILEYSRFIAIEEARKLKTWEENPYLYRNAKRHISAINNDLPTYPEKK
ncbi:helix-turn-helix domain-containing protein [Lactococcus raffinolactis]|uniref:Helix-turn-helix domain-containing protein n=1 Tax=Pseudolactococcus raffinolactis TaxID=1366 RepID=A0A6H0UFA3_9LACT|nr:helix-turn-helix transcriptional regulator [Lactococcus raffinolactis]QIW54268.1 helix-turn-helix domain-containing protein [Lactococcus raffinolactis]